MKSIIPFPLYVGPIRIWSPGYSALISQQNVLLESNEDAASITAPMLYGLSPIHNTRNKDRFDYANNYNNRTRLNNLFIIKNQNNLSINYLSRSFTIRRSDYITIKLLCRSFQIPIIMVIILYLRMIK